MRATNLHELPWADCISSPHLDGSQNWIRSRAGLHWLSISRPLECCTALSIHRYARASISDWTQNVVTGITDVLPKFLRREVVA